MWTFGYFCGTSSPMEFRTLLVQPVGVGADFTSPPFGSLHYSIVFVSFFKRFTSYKAFWLALGTSQVDLCLFYILWRGFCTTPVKQVGMLMLLAAQQLDPPIVSSSFIIVLTVLLMSVRFFLPARWFGSVSNHNSAETGLHSASHSARWNQADASPIWRRYSREKLVSCRPQKSKNKRLH